MRCLWDIHEPYWHRIEAGYGCDYYLVELPAQEAHVISENHVFEAPKRRFELLIESRINPDPARW